MALFDESGTIEVHDTLVRKRRVFSSSAHPPLSLVLLKRFHRNDARFIK
jgi:hypothetical protein